MTWVLIDTPLNNTQQMYDTIDHFIYLPATCMHDTPNSRKWTAEVRRSASIPHECSTPTEASVARWSIGNFWRFGVKISVETKKNREIHIFISIFCHLYFNYLHTILNSSKITRWFTSINLSLNLYCLLIYNMLSNVPRASS